MKSVIVDKPYLEHLTNIERKKYLQKVRLIKYVYMEGAKSNADLCSLLNISSPTSLSLINELIEEGLLHKKGKGASVGGRRPELYSLCDNSFYILCIDIERFKTKVAILDNNNNWMTEIKSMPLPISGNLNTIDQLYDMANELATGSGINLDKLVGIGVSMPGLVDTKEGNNLTYLTIDKKVKSLQEILKTKFKKPVFIQNDVKSATLAECRLGLAHHKKDVLVLSMDWGIGLGIVMDGQLRSGSSGFSGEIGHIPFVDDGALCYCGKRGCLETVASGIALARMAKEGIKSGQSSILNELSDQEIDQIEPHLVVDAANLGDQYAINILADTGIKLGKGIATLIQLFNPELIILSGKIAEAKQYISIPIQQSINTYCMTQIREKVKIVLSKLGPDAALLGSTYTVMENILQQQIELAGLSPAMLSSEQSEI